MRLLGVPRLNDELVLNISVLPGRLESNRRKVNDVRFGSKADIVGYQRDVRFTPKSGHC